MLLIVGFTFLLPVAVVLLTMVGLQINVPALGFAGGMAVDAVVNVFNVYLSIVAMRLIGLYYLHFKKRFTLVLE
jgi:hypothetical protein